MKSLHKVYDVHAPVFRVWLALVTPKIIAAWGAGPAVMQAKAKTKFSLWGGDVHGTNIEIIAPKKLVQDWFSGNWETPSIVTISLAGHDDHTHIELKQTSIPDEEAKDIDLGWDDYYFGPFISYLESHDH